jgi:NodT family efflux transporter outer membrane factor (OMF) lipoprotein
MRALRPLSLTLLCAVLVGCTVGPDYHPPQISMPAGFAASSASATARTEMAPGRDAVDLAEWWRSVKDPELDSLVEQAIKGNLDLEIALTRLQQARTQGAVALGEALPEIQASGAAGRGTGSDVTRGLVAAPLHAADNTKGFSQIRQVIGFDAGWEIDLFGKYRREIEASNYDVQAATAARNAVLISVVADVVRTYFDLRAFQMRMAVTRQNIATSQQTLDVVQARYDRGLTNELDLTLAKRELATVKAKVAPLASEIDAARYTIATLLGRYPEDLGKELENPGVIPDLPGEVGTGLPVDLLRRRPDILEAERQLASATARIGVATANLFPHLSLTAAVGFQAGRGAGMSPMTTNPIWSAGPTAYWSLLDFGTLDALVNVADLQARAQLINYKRTIINAVQEADTAISRYTAQQDRLRSLGDAVVASQRAVTLATERYNRGLTDFLNVSDAERVEYDLEGQYVVAKQAAAVALVALYKALGGGWEHYGSLPPIRQPQPAIVAAFRRLLFDNENAEQ